MDYIHWFSAQNLISLIRQGLNLGLGPGLGGQVMVPSLDIVELCLVVIKFNNICLTISKRGDIYLAHNMKVILHMSRVPELLELREIPQI